MLLAMTTSEAGPVLGSLFILLTLWVGNILFKK